MPIDGGSRAMSERYKGPYTIERMIGKDAAKLILPPSMLVHPVFHVSLLKPVTEAQEHLRRDTTTQEPIRGDEYIVEDILDHRNTEDGLEYLVRWWDGSTTWEPDEHMQNARDLVKRYFRGRQRTRNVEP